MKCKNCGREIKKGELECECGTPIEQAEAAAEKKSGLTTPDGRDLAALEKPAVKKTDISPVVLIAIAAVIAIIAFIVYKVIVGSDIRDKDNWKEVSTDTYTITLPKAMKKSNKNIETDTDFTKVDFYKCSKASVYISKAELNEDEKELLKKRGVSGMRTQAYENGKNQVVNGFKLSPEIHGDFVIVEYPLDAQDYVDDEEELWAVSATLITEDCIYQIDAFCADEKKEDYAEVMTRWIESFKLK